MFGFILAIIFILLWLSILIILIWRSYLFKKEVILNRFGFYKERIGGQIGNLYFTIPLEKIKLYNDYLEIIYLDGLIKLPYNKITIQEQNNKIKITHEIINIPDLIRIFSPNAKNICKFINYKNIIS